MSGIVSPGFLSSLAGFTVLGRPQIYYQGPDTHIMELLWMGSSWSVSDLVSRAGAVAPRGGGFLMGFNVPDAFPHIYYQSLDDRVMELEWTGSIWSASDLTARAGAQRPYSDDLAGFNVPSISPHVYYLALLPDATLIQTLESHVMELEWTGSAWLGSDLTARAGARATRDRSPLVGFNVPSISPRVYYFSPDNHVTELEWTGSAWSASDLTAQAGAVPATLLSSLAGIIDRFLHVYYLSPLDHVIELFWNGSSWVSSDLTALTGAPSAFGPLVGFSDHIGPHVYYQGPDNHIMELRWAGSWKWADVTALGKASLAANGSPLVAFMTPDEFPHVYYLSPEFHLVELKWTGAGGWSGSEITA